MKKRQKQLLQKQITLLNNENQQLSNQLIKIQGQLQQSLVSKERYKIKYRETKQRLKDLQQLNSKIQKKSKNYIHDDPYELSTQGQFKSLKDTTRKTIFQQESKAIASKLEMNNAKFQALETTIKQLESAVARIGEKMDIYTLKLEQSPSNYNLSEILSQILDKLKQVSLIRDEIKKQMSEQLKLFTKTDLRKNEVSLSPQINHFSLERHYQINKSREKPRKNIQEQNLQRKLLLHFGNQLKSWKIDQEQENSVSSPKSRFK